MDAALVLVRRDDEGVVTLTLNRPDQRNALDAALAEAFRSALEAVRRDARARALLLTGAGPAFSGGGDLRMLEELAAAPAAEARTRMLAFYHSFLGLVDLEIPTVAAIHGAAMGAGLAIALACDFRIVAREARLGLNFVKLGLSPGMGTTFLVPRLVGAARAADLLLTGRSLSGEEAVAIGLCHEARGAAEVGPRARVVAAELAAGAPLALRATRRALRRDLAGLGAALEEEAELQARCYATSDLREGIAAVRERRAPRFEGR
jgi:enoyl-CoA hydratase/carnithine racemase